MWRIDQVQRTISPMIRKEELLKAVALGTLVSIITLVPYGLAISLAKPEGVFGGFLVNPIDGFSYLAKMRQGYEGQWLFHLPYTVESGEGAFIFLFYIFLGHLSRWTGIPSIVLYHLVRFLGSVFMFSMAFVFVSQFFKTKILRWGAYGIILLGGGLGWIGVPFGLLASDLWIVESIPFLTAYANAHFPLATALFLALVLIFLIKARATYLNMIVIFLISTVFAMIQPFSMVPLFIILFLWLLLETWIEANGHEGSILMMRIREKWFLFFAMIAGALPWFIYDYLLTIHHPVIAAWNEQNITLSPPIYDYILGFGAIFVLAVFGILKGLFRSTKEERLLLVWVIAQALLLYAPFALQRRLSLGLFFALVILALLTLNQFVVNQKRIRLLVLAVLILSIPSNLIVLGSGIAGMMKKDPLVVLEKDEMMAYQWLSSNAVPGEIILAGTIAGNRIPAFATLRVFYGHPFETVNAKESKALIEGIFSAEDVQDDGIEELQSMRVTYVFYGPEERELGQPEWLEGLDANFISGEYSIYEISAP